MTAQERPRQARVPQYAAATEVPVERTQDQIRKMLKDHGATGVVIGYHEGTEMVAFVLEGLHIRFTFETPLEEHVSRRKDGTMLPRYQIKAAIEQAHRSAWRELHLNIKAKLVMCATRFRVVSQEFMADIVMPTGQTVHEWAQPQLRAMIAEGRMPPLLPGAGPHQQAIEE